MPGTDAHRPAQAPPQNGIANLYLSGDYTQTDWPATMEGGRSGYRAADAVLQQAGTSKPFLVPARAMAGTADGSQVNETVYRGVTKC